MNPNKDKGRTGSRKTPRPKKTTKGYCSCFHCTGNRKGNPTPLPKIPESTKRIVEEVRDDIIEEKKEEEIDYRSRLTYNPELRAYC